MYRIYRRKQSLSLDCTWVETYDLGFSAMNEELTRQRRTQEGVNIKNRGQTTFYAGWRL